MDSQTIRRRFLTYFKEKGHTIVPSSPVSPHDDPTLLFVNAGMNQFKDTFLGKATREYTRATTSQKCIRVGGKHNDLDNVGHTSRHLTFFEMLGNFSFGDYFKKEAIQFSWDVATHVFEFDPEKLWPTVFREDDEAFELWTQYVPAERITRFDEKDNFWEMGDTGPCGPCSELFYDRGPDFGDACNIKEDVKEVRYLEFWNLVFMQFNRCADGSTIPLPKPSIDTGAGLERICSLKNNIPTLFETDVLFDLISHVERSSNIPYQPNNPDQAAPFRVIADHLRSLSFSIADGIQPSNVDRGYVLRKILRRAVRYGRTLGFKKPFLADLLPSLVARMGDDFPELKKSENHIAEILTLEEESFLKTLQRGGNLLNQVIANATQKKRPVTGEEAFKLKDTYGMPLEEILLLAKDNHLTVDLATYRNLEEEAKERSRKSHKVTHQTAEISLFEEFIKKNPPCEFLGYTQNNAQGKVVGLLKDGSFVESLSNGEEGGIIVDKTPFYAEMGGQVGDHGTLGNSDTLFSVSDCQTPFKGVILHMGTLKKGSIKLGDTLELQINTPYRKGIQNNHTATHLLHWALHKVLGEHVQQAGSVVAADRLRFDLTHHKKISNLELRQIEQLVNEKIITNTPLTTTTQKFSEIQKDPSIKQLFGEKYGHEVRVVDIGNFSKELCGGTHANQLGEIGYFRIIKESSIAAGVRRIEAATGPQALQYTYQQEDLLKAVAEQLNSTPQKILSRIERLTQEQQELTKTIKQLKQQKQSGTITQLLEQKQMIQGIPFIAVQMDGEVKNLRQIAKQLLDQIKDGIVVLGNVQEKEQCQLLIQVSAPLIAKGIKANEWIKELAPIINGGGGGKADSAQAGGKASEKIPEALKKAKTLLEALHVPNS